MPVNLELKARIHSTKNAISTLKNIGAKKKETLNQKDIYYNIFVGRLKLRIINNKYTELIFYKRSNKKGVRFSQYEILRVKNINATQKFFNRIYGEKLVVEKKRLVYIYKNARIHLDKVKGLGNFLEFEVLVNRGKEQAKDLMKKLINYFSVKEEDILGCSYSDLIVKS